MKVIVDKSKEFEEFIVQEYHQELSELHKRTMERCEEILLEFRNDAEVKSEEILMIAERDAEVQKIKRIAEINDKIRSELAIKRDILYEKVHMEIKKKFEELPKRNKVLIVKGLLNSIQERIKSLGMKKEDFTFKIWEGYPKNKLPKRSKITLKTLSIEADNKHIFLEESIDERLNNISDSILKEINIRI